MGSGWGKLQLVTYFHGVQHVGYRFASSHACHSNYHHTDNLFVAGLLTAFPSLLYGKESLLKIRCDRTDRG